MIEPPNNRHTESMTFIFFRNIYLFRFIDHIVYLPLGVRRICRHNIENNGGGPSTGHYLGIIGHILGIMEVSTLYNCKQGVVRLLHEQRFSFRPYCLCRIQVDSKALQILRERANINSACDDTDFRSGIEIQ